MCPEQRAAYESEAARLRIEAGLAQKAAVARAFEGSGTRIVIDCSYGARQLRSAAAAHGAAHVSGQPAAVLFPARPSRADQLPPPCSNCALRPAPRRPRAPRPAVTEVEERHAPRHGERAASVAGEGSVRSLAKQIEIAMALNRRWAAQEQRGGQTGMEGGALCRRLLLLAARHPPPRRPPLQPTSPTPATRPPRHPAPGPRLPRFEAPAALTVTSFKGPLAAFAARLGAASWPLERHEAHVLEVFGGARGRVVMLTPDADEPLAGPLEPGAVYVVGGIVDRWVWLPSPGACLERRAIIRRGARHRGAVACAWCGACLPGCARAPRRAFVCTPPMRRRSVVKGLSLGWARAAGVRAARLPVREQAAALGMEFAGAKTTPVLSISDVVVALLEAGRSGGDWAGALRAALPERVRRGAGAAKAARHAAAIAGAPAPQHSGSRPAIDTAAV